MVGHCPAEIWNLDLPYGRAIPRALNLPIILVAIQIAQNTWKVRLYTVSNGFPSHSLQFFCYTAQQCRLSDCTHLGNILTHVGIIVGLIQKHYNFTTQNSSDGVHMSIAFWGIGGFWTMKANTMACESLVQPSKNCDQPHWERKFHTFCSTQTSTEHWMKLYNLSWPHSPVGSPHAVVTLHGSLPACLSVQSVMASQSSWVTSCCGHIAWYSTCSSLCTTNFYPLDLHTYPCCSCMPCRS